MEYAEVFGPRRAEDAARVVAALRSWRRISEAAEVQIGVLYDRCPELGHTWLEALQGHGYDVRANEPWSGLGGYMHAPQRHADAHGRRAVELEIRQDLLLDPEHVLRLLDVVESAIGRLHV